jgi:hypothetical protein
LKKKKKKMENRIEKKRFEAERIGKKERKKKKN